ncbi:hypothetical protein GC173_09630 [bacterium]|nr:hypothetical protein [bacterium]
MKHTESEQTPPIETALEHIGAAAREKSAPRSSLSLRVMQQISDDSRSPGVRFLEWLLTRRTSTLVAATVAVVAIAVTFELTGQQEVGRVTVSEGEATVVAKKEVIQSQAADWAIGNLDGDRIVFFLDEKSAMTVQTVDTVALSEGSAWFGIEPNSGYFRVELPAAAIVVHGTKFAVRTNQQASSVYLVEGSISLEVAEGTQTLQPGMEAVVNHVSGEVKITTHHQDRPPKWSADVYARFMSAHTAAYFPSARKGK